MMSKIKLIVIVVILLAAGFFAYSYFFVSNKDTSTNLKDVSKSGASADVTSTTASSSKEISQNDQYVKQLIALRAISFNFDLFSDDAYKILHAANTDIAPEEKGRHNPFAPLEAGDGDFLSGTTTTGAGFQITSTTTPRLPTAPNAPRAGISR